MEVISYRELQRMPHKVLDAFIEESDRVHWSDCAIYNEPAYPKGGCDCGAIKTRDKKLIITVENQYHYEIRLYEDFKAND